MDGNIFPRAKYSQQFNAMWFSWATNAICCVKRLVSIFRLCSIASIAMQIYVFPRIPTKHACTAENHQSIPRPVRFSEMCKRTRFEQLCSCLQLGKWALFHHSQVCFSSTAVSVCEIHSMNEPRGASSETVAHWLCLNGSGAVIGQETHQLLFYPWIHTWERLCAWLISSPLENHLFPVAGSRSATLQREYT